LNITTRSGRQRLLDTILDAMAESGYRESDFEGDLRRAGIGEGEIAAEFGGRDACLLAAYERLLERLLERVAGRCSLEGAWPQRIRAGLEVLLDELASQPEMARVVVRSFPAVQSPAYKVYLNFLGALVPFFEEGRSYSGAELPREIETLAVGSAATIVFAEIEAGDVERLPSLMAPILYSILVPFLGPEEAAAVAG
jgi:AcrR family transcriptional regulator